jgi:uncharacterized protein YjdB
VTPRLTPSAATNISVSFKSSKPAGLHVDAAGRMSARAKGRYTVTVKAGRKSVRKAVTVK